MSKSLYQTNVESRAPLTTDVGVVGNWWIDTSASPVDLYLCTDTTGGVYTWTKQGSGSSGKYQHNVTCKIGNNNANKIYFSFINDVSTPYTTSSGLRTAIKDAGFNDNTHAISCTGIYRNLSNSNQTLETPESLYVGTGNNSFLICSTLTTIITDGVLTFTTGNTEIQGINLGDVYDKVVAL